MMRKLYKKGLYNKRSTLGENYKIRELYDKKTIWWENYII